MPLDPERHMRFWRAEATERPLLTFWMGPYYPLERYPHLARRLPSGDLSPHDIDIPALLQDQDLLLSMHSGLDSDIGFYSSALHGFPWVEAILGCRVRAAGNSFWAEPFLDDWGDLQGLPRRIDSGWWHTLQDVMSALVSHAQGAYHVPLPGLRCGSDALVGVRGGMRVPLDFYDHPQEIREFEAFCVEVWERVMADMLALLPSHEGGYCSRDYGVWAPAQVLLAQDDSSSLLSPKFFRNFILPVVRRMLSGFEYSIFHLHPSNAFILEDILGLEALGAVELNYEVAGPSLEAMLPIWRRIQTSKPLIVYGHFAEHEIETVARELDCKGLALHPVVTDVEQARRIQAVVARATASP